MISKQPLIKTDFSAIIGHSHVKSQIKSALLAQRHILIVGPPGIGKTTLAKSIAEILPEIDIIADCPYHCTPDKPICPQCMKKTSHKKSVLKGKDRFIRIQGSPDLTSEDILGDIDPIKALKFGAQSQEAFTPGKLFKAHNGLLFFDEVNRCPEKLQNALLQVLQEGYATIGGYDVDIPTNFIFIGTMNPEDFTGTERLSEVFLDRFDVIYMDYPETAKDEVNIVKEHAATQDAIVDEKLYRFVASFIRHLREDADLEKAPSVRADIGLIERAAAHTVLNNRKNVTVNDIKEHIVSVLRHRIKLRPSFALSKEPEKYLAQKLQEFLNHNEEFKQMVNEEEGKPG